MRQTLGQVITRQNKAAQSVVSTNYRCSTHGTVDLSDVTAIIDDFLDGQGWRQYKQYYICGFCHEEVSVSQRSRLIR